jgi:hypothetical protein
MAGRQSKCPSCGGAIVIGSSDVAPIPVGRSSPTKKGVPAGIIAGALALSIALITFIAVVVGLATKSKPPTTEWSGDVKAPKARAPYLSLDDADATVEWIFNAALNWERLKDNDLAQQQAMTDFLVACKLGTGQRVSWLLPVGRVEAFPDSIVVHIREFSRPYSYERYKEIIEEINLTERWNPADFPFISIGFSLAGQGKALGGFVTPRANWLAGLRPGDKVLITGEFQGIRWYKKPLPIAVYGFDVELKAVNVAQRR